MKKIKILLPAIICLLVFLLYSYKLKQSLFYHPDFARDAHEILRISQGKIVWLGPKLTFGGLYLGPYYFYLFVPAYLLSGRQLISLHFFNAFLFILAVGYFFVRSAKKFKFIQRLSAGLVLALSTLFLIGSRNPSNAYSFIPLFLFLLTEVYFFNSKNDLWLGFLGFLYGVVVNFHFIIFIFFPGLIIYFWKITKEKKRLRIFLLGLILSFLPLAIFELTHHFVMLKNTFIDKSYLKWVNNTNIPGGLSGKKNVLANIWFLSESMKSYVLINPLFIYFILGIIFHFRKPDCKIKIIYLNSLLTLLLAAVILRFQFIPHYLFGLAFYLFFNLIFIFLSFKNNLLSMIFFSLMIAFQLFYFPKTLYQPSWRTPERFEKAVDFVIKNKLVSPTNFNIIQITKQNLLATIGYEYRYFFRKAGYIADSEFLYSQSKELIVFSEIPYQDISQFDSWEAEQFGKQYFPSAKKYSLPGITIYKIVKK